MKKILITMLLVVMMCFCFAGCSNKKWEEGNLDYIDVNTYNEEYTSASFFLLFGSYTKNNDEYIRYIFLGQTGVNNSYQISIIDLNIQYNNKSDTVSFIYIEESETPKIKYREILHMGYGDCMEYVLYVPKSKVLEMIIKI